MHSIPSLIGFSQHHGEWFAEGISLSVLASQYGTPLYVYSKHAICSAYRAYDVACIRANGSRRARIHYAVKANSNLAVLDELKQLGAGFDLVSGGELARA
ncbi:MAG: diaminopimelate decarboxylase, partial [Burkholderiaceae bacterium]|nr:diaminopimelate decarboxylase [Burkholderiaceae bacterium]